MFVCLRSPKKYFAFVLKWQLSFANLKNSWVTVTTTTQDSLHRRSRTTANMARKMVKKGEGKNLPPSIMYVAVSPDENFEKAPNWTPKCATDAPHFVKDAPIFWEMRHTFYFFIAFLLTNSCQISIFLAKFFCLPKIFCNFFGQRLHVRKTLMIFYKRKKMNKRPQKGQVF